MSFVFYSSLSSNRKLILPYQAKDCDPANGPPCHGIENEYSSVLIYDTVEACCGRLDWIVTSSCVSASEESPTGSLTPDSTLPSNQFFADYSSNSCLKDCEPGPFGCMRVPPPVALYDSIEACCSVGMWWIDYSYCTSRSVGNYTNGWTVDFPNEKCSEFCYVWYYVTYDLLLNIFKS